MTDFEKATCDLVEKLRIFSTDTSFLSNNVYRRTLIFISCIKKFTHSLQGGDNLKQLPSFPSLSIF